MRKIKYRIWNKTRKEFSYIELFSKSEDKSNIHTTLDVFRSRNFEEPQQLTGLKDKNGVDIYEGDIIKYIYENKCISPIFKEVIFDDGRYWVDDQIIYQDRIHKLKLEIVGNIYENPELIEGIK